MKTVVITGGSDGLGKAIAEILSESKDYQLYLLAQIESLLQTAASETGSKYYKCDVSDYDQVETVFKKVIEETGKIDVLINCAGVWLPDVPLEEHNPAEIKHLLEVNSLGVIHTTKAVIPYMKHQKSGTIVQINSQGGLEGKAGRSVYYPSKWLVTGFTKSMQLELEPFNIKVVGVHPGLLDTKLFEKQGVTKDMKRALNPKEVAKVIKFILETAETTYIPEFRIKYLRA